MAVTTELDRAVTERLAKHDLRYTTGRRQIVSGLRRAGGPVTLPELLQIQSDLAQSSAYRNLSLMEDAGVVRRLVEDAVDLFEKTRRHTGSLAECRGPYWAGS